MSQLITSWIDSANAPDSPFPLNNLPYGVFSTPQLSARCGVAIGAQILDVQTLESRGLLSLEGGPLLHTASWNPLMAVGKVQWESLRQQLISLLKTDGDHRLQSDDALCQAVLIDAVDAELHMPCVVAEYTDFYAGKYHATNVGTMFRGAENALPPNWLHIPIGYNGRASSVVVSGTDVRRPWGQLKGPADEQPRFAPCARFDIELEMGALVGSASSGPITVAEADENIFGYVLLNDWSARDIQAWEYQPLGPFQAKATATTISPWIVTKSALEPFRVSTPEREKTLLPYLDEPGPGLYNIELSVQMLPQGGNTTSTIARTNYQQMYYSAAQQLAHHSTSGCPMRTGDLLGSGTISGPEREERGSLLELSWGGKEPITLDCGASRSFIEDGDTLTLIGEAVGDGYRIGFGDCTGQVIAALDDPYSR